MDVFFLILDYKLWISRRTTMLLVVMTLMVNTFMNAQQVDRESRTELGGTAVFLCKLNGNNESLTQISWKKETKKQPHTVNFFTISEENGANFVNGKDDRFKFIGNFKEKNGTLQLSDVTLGDEGTYKCIFTLYPSGYVERPTSLKVFVPPLTNLRGLNPSLGSEEVALATCTAAGSKPPSEVRWLTGSLRDKVRVTADSTVHDNGTTTTVSSLFGVPSRDICHQSVQCVITGPALKREKTLSLTIQVHYAPLDVIVTESSANSFQCLAEAYPYAGYLWTRADGSWPESEVRVDNTTLQFLSAASKLRGLYICEASNSYGSKRGYLFVHFPGSRTPLGAIIIISLILVAVAGVVYLYKSGKLSRFIPSREDGTRGERQTVPTTSSSPDENQRIDEGEEEGEELRGGVRAEGREEEADTRA